jgi:hypothetical protein
MQGIAGMTHKPPNDLGRFVRAVVVHDHVHVAIGRQRGVHALKEFEKLLMPMTRIALADDLALCDFQRREQGRGAVADIIVRPGSASPGLQRQAGLCAIQGLNLALFINAEHNCVLWGIQIDAHHVQQFRHEVRIT